MNNVKLASRQVHLDFHASEFIPDVGRRFSKENFQMALKMGNVNSITIWLSYITCEQELQRHGPILKGGTWTLRFYTSRRFNKLNCVGWVRLSEEGQRKWIFILHSM
jgi:hypothetical protein